MGITESKGSHDEQIELELAELLKETDFEQEEIMLLYEEYREVSRNMSPLDKKQFHQVLDRVGLLQHIADISIQHLEPPQTGKKTAGPGALSEGDAKSEADPIPTLHLSESAVIKDMVNALFRMFDENCDNRLDFKEFIYGISVLLRGSLDQKAMLVFRIYDANRDGSITKSELFVAIKNAMKSAKKIKTGSMKQFKEDMGRSRAHDLGKKLEEISKDRCIQLIVEEIFSEADPSGTGTISKEDFVDFVRRYPEALQPISQIVADFSLLTPRSRGSSGSSSSSG